MQGVVFNIQRHSIHDGPGVRTTVFLKGCSLRCLWCHNPESLEHCPQLRFFSQKCVGCGECYAACPSRVLRLDNNRRVYLKNACKLCGICVEICYAEALFLCGKMMTVDEVTVELNKDRYYYETSGGGVTFSGGEPLLQTDFLKLLLIECKNNGYHTAVDTAGNVPWQKFESVMPHVDLWLYDIKAYDGEKHRQATGADNATILDNLRRLASAAKNIVVRVPIVPGINDDAVEIGRMADMLSETRNINCVELLRLNHMAQGKYDSLDMEYKAKGYPVPSPEDLKALAEIFSAKGLIAKYN